MHTLSGLQFPASIGEATRVKVLQYDSEGMNISVGYNYYQEPQCRLLITLYIYPTPRMSYLGANPDVVEATQASFLKNEFPRTKADILRVHPGAVIESEGPRSALGGATALYARFKLPPGTYSWPVSILSDIRLRIFNDEWFLKYRLTYAEPCPPLAESQLSVLTAYLSRVAPNEALSRFP